jgi:hypothetical protein
MQREFRKRLLQVVARKDSANLVLQACERASRMSKFGGLGSGDATMLVAFNIIAMMAIGLASVSISGIYSVRSRNSVKQKSLLWED